MDQDEKQLLKDVLEMQRKTLELLQVALETLRAVVEGGKPDTFTVTPIPYTQPNTFTPYTPLGGGVIISGGSGTTGGWQGNGTLSCSNSSGLDKKPVFLTGLTLANSIEDLCSRNSVKLSRSS